MNKIPATLVRTWLSLILLSLVTGLFALAGLGGSSWHLLSITGIASVKIMIVANFFMELRHAHSFWPVALWVLILIISALFLVLLLL